MSRLRARVLSVTAAAVSVAAITAAVVVPNSEAERPTPGIPTSQIDERDAPLEQGFAVLREPAATGIAVKPLPEQTRANIAERFPFLGLHPEAARHVAYDGTVDVWVVPGEEGACLFWTAVHSAALTTTDGVCDETERVVRGALTGTGTLTIGGGGTLIGLTVDGNERVSARLEDGTVVTAPVESNVYVIRGPTDTFDDLAFSEQRSDEGAARP